MGSLQVKQLLTRPLSRLFGPLRKIELMEPGSGFNVIPAPQLGDTKVTILPGPHSQIPITILLDLSRLPTALTQLYR